MRAAPIPEINYDPNTDAGSSREALGLDVVLRHLDLLLRDAHRGLVAAVQHRHRVAGDQWPAGHRAADAHQFAQLFGQFSVTVLRFMGGHLHGRCLDLVAGPGKAQGEPEARAAPG